MTAVLGTAAAVGVIGGVGLAFGGGSSGSAPVPPGIRSQSPSSMTVTTDPGPRQVPRVASRPGPAPGQKSPDGRTVLASGTTNGKPWQVTEFFNAHPATQDSVFGQLRPGEGPCLELRYWLAGTMAAEGYSCGGGGPVRGGYTQILNSDSDQEWVFLVPEDVVKIAWIGTDGFRQEVRVAPARDYAGFGRLGVAVFADSGVAQAKAGDRFVGYDSAGKEVGEYVRIRQEQLPSSAPPGS